MKESLGLKEGTDVTSKLQGTWPCQAWKDCFFVVWAGKGDPFVGLIHFEAELWQQVLPNLPAEGNSLV